MNTCQLAEHMIVSKKTLLLFVIKGSCIARIKAGTVCPYDPLKLQTLTLERDTSQELYCNWYTFAGNCS